MLKKVKCWVCRGTGWVQGPLYKESCPNAYCPHRKDLRPETKDLPIWDPVLNGY